MGLTVVPLAQSKARAPYGYNKETSAWVGYDDVESMRYKVNEVITKRGK